MTATFESLWAEIAPIGRDDKGGYLRYALSEPELILRDWFRNQADERGRGNRAKTIHFHERGAIRARLHPGYDPTRTEWRAVWPLCSLSV